MIKVLSKLSKSEKTYIKELVVCRLATVTKKCNPVVRPVWPVFDGETFYVATDPGTPKLQHIKANPEVSLVLDDYDINNWSNVRGVRVQGRASVLWKGEEYRQAHSLLKEKYPEYRTEEGGWKEGELPIIKIVPKTFVKWEEGDWKT